MTYALQAFGWLAIALSAAGCSGGGFSASSSGSGGAQTVSTGGAGDNGGNTASAGGDTAVGGTTSVLATSTGPDLDQVPKLYAEGACAALTKCSAALASLMLGANDCETLVTAQGLNGNFPGIQAAVSSGTVVYDPSAMSNCHDALAAAGCGLSDNPYLPACESALAGTVAEGGNCAINEECAGDLYCNYAGSCPGTCSAREAEGALCRQDSDCQAGLACFIQSGSAGTCTKKPQLGEACGDDRPSTCASQSSGAGVICWGASSSKNGKCVAIDAIAAQGIGADCHLLEGTLCVAGASCQLAPNSLNGTCVATVASGTTCTPAFPDSCPNDQYCTATGTATAATGSCSLLPLDGKACVNTALAVLSNKQCGNQTVCISGTCVGLRENGSACTSNSVCYSGRCDSQSQQCVPNQNCSP